MKKKGFVYLLGAGPGDPGLFTIKGKEVLEKAEVVVYDRLVGDEILKYCSDDAELIYVGKQSGNHALSQDEINALLVEKAQQGNLLVRLKGGDPFVFGRGGEEALYIKEHGINFEIVPGISSSIAVPAYAGIPVTHRGVSSSFAVITGHEKPDKTESSINWSMLATATDTLVFLMGLENLDFIVKNLISSGRDINTPVAVIREGSLPRQEIITACLADIVEKVNKANFKSPALIVVGKTVELQAELAWLERKELWGSKIVVTRARAQASTMVKKIEELGGLAIELPSIEIQKETNLSRLYEAFEHLQDYDWLIFTSVNAVDIFFAELQKNHLDIRSLYGIKICAIGPATRMRLEERGLIVELVPDEFVAEGIIKKMASSVKAGERVLLPRARDARKILPEGIRQLGAELDEIYLYKSIISNNIDEEQLEEVKYGKVDYLTFTSSSTVKNFVNILGKDSIKDFNFRVKVACIGPVTAATAEEYGFTVDILADEYTIDGLLNAVKEDWQRNK